MADYFTRRRTQAYIEVLLPNPTNSTELEKAYSVIEQKWAENHGSTARRYDDSIKVRADEEHIILYFEMGTEYAGL